MRVIPASYRVTLVALGAILLAESLLSASWSFAQQATVRVSVDRVNSDVFSMNYKLKYSGVKRTPELIFDKFLLELYKREKAQGRTLPSSRAVEIMQGFRNDYESEVTQGRPGDYNKIQNKRKLIESLFKVAGKTPVLGPIAEEVFKHTMDRAFKELDAASQLNSNFKKHDKHLQAAQIEDQILQEIRKTAQGNPSYADAWNTLRAHELTMTATDDARTIMARNTDLPVPLQVKVSIQDNHGEILIALADLKKLSQEEFDKLGAVMAETREDLKAIDAQQDELIAFVKVWKADQDAAELERQRQATIAAERQLKLQAAGAAIDLLSTFVGLVDPKLGRELAVTGRAGLEIYAAVVNYTQMAATLGSLGSGLGAVVLTGSVVGSVMNVVSLFGESGPSPEQMILEELQALREQVAQLHQDMHDRFDRVDAALNTI